MENFRFCPACGGAVEYRVPDCDDRARAVCGQCQAVHYQNPRIVVGVVAWWQERVLLCRRGIAPRIGFWAFPAGYLELAETTEDGALREAWEEACAEIEISRLLAVYNLAHLNQVQILYLGELKHKGVAAGPESLEVELFKWSEIPWQELAFPSVQRALQHARNMREGSLANPDLQSRELELDPKLL
ncbi:MAG: NUDIX hydrolase [Candidatus Melainabacteria bacterium HGW-Melainabacteria-1]|nr:MAG: NUDIX hydrolase [Candidatus Melainabacteria bacterium HGW-Melainabacteria-1]